eukprot:5315761-Pyramimonas_sp.AAC.1
MAVQGYKAGPRSEQARARPRGHARWRDWDIALTRSWKCERHDHHGQRSRRCESPGEHARA